MEKTNYKTSALEDLKTKILYLEEIYEKKEGKKYKWKTANQTSKARLKFPVKKEDHQSGPEEISNCNDFIEQKEKFYIRKKYIEPSKQDEPKLMQSGSRLASNDEVKKEIEKDLEITGKNVEQSNSSSRSNQIPLSQLFEERRKQFHNSKNTKDTSATLPSVEKINPSMTASVLPINQNETIRSRDPRLNRTLNQKHTEQKNSENNQRAKQNIDPRLIQTSRLNTNAASETVNGIRKTIGPISIETGNSERVAMTKTLNETRNKIIDPRSIQTSTLRTIGNTKNIEPRLIGTSNSQRVVAKATINEPRSNLNPKLTQTNEQNIQQIVKKETVTESTINIESRLIGTSNSERVTTNRDPRTIQTSTLNTDVGRGSIIGKTKNIGPRLIAPDNSQKVAATANINEPKNNMNPKLTQANEQNIHQVVKALTVIENTKNNEPRLSETSYSERLEDTQILSEKTLDTENNNETNFVNTRGESQAEPICKEEKDDTEDEDMLEESELQQYRHEKRKRKTNPNRQSKNKSKRLKEIKTEIEEPVVTQNDASAAQVNPSETSGVPSNDTTATQVTAEDELIEPIKKELLDDNTPILNIPVNESLHESQEVPNDTNIFEIKQEITENGELLQDIKLEMEVDDNIEMKNIEEDISPIIDYNDPAVIKMMIENIIVFCLDHRYEYFCKICNFISVDGWIFKEHIEQHCEKWSGLCNICDSYIFGEDKTLTEEFNHLLKVHMKVNMKIQEKQSDQPQLKIKDLSTNF